MYHIKSDKRSQKSAQLITASFLNLTKSKSFQNITITDIEKESGVARSTFYRLFDNTVDVLSYKCDQIFQNLIEYHTSHRPDGMDSLMQSAASYWMQNSYLLEAVYKSGHQDILIESFNKNYPEIMAAYQKSPRPEYKRDQDYYSSLLSSMISSSLLTWVKNGRQETAEELWAILKNLIQEMYQTFC